MTSTPERTLGVIGGSGLYAIEGIDVVRELRAATPFGEPSDAIMEAFVGTTRLLFLPRHARGHRIPPHEVNYRANIFALKVLGAEQLIAVSAVGSMKEELSPGTLVTIDQFIDRTRSRRGTFFESCGVVAHVSIADPVDAALRATLFASAKETGAPVVDGGAYVCIEGPQFSTRAESEIYRREGASVIGMTQMPEARLAREAELPFASLCLVTDYDCWHPGEADVDVSAVVAVMKKNSDLAGRSIIHAAGRLPDPKASPASSAMAHAIMTAPEHVPEQTKRDLAPLLAKYVGSHG